MLRILTTLVLASITAFAAPALAQDKTYASAKDAYLEGWFQETAQRDLQSALAAYRACIAKGDDRELAAKAMLRMALIARALGDEDAAKAQLAEVGEKYADTAAAKSAKAWSEVGRTGAAEGAQAAGAESAVAEAKKTLEVMITTPESTTTTKVGEVFRILDANDLIEVRKRSAGDLRGVMYALVLLQRADVLADLALSTDQTFSDNTIRQIDQCGGASVQFGGRLLPLLERPSNTRYELLKVMASQRDPASLARLAEYVRAGDNLGVSSSLLGMLDENPAEGVDAPVDALIDFVAREAEKGNSVVVPYSPLASDKPTARRLIARYANLPGVLRQRQVHDVVNRQSENGKPVLVASDPLIRLALEDPEPAIRRLAVARLISDADPANVEDGLRRFFAEPPPWDIGMLEQRLRGSAHLPSLEAVLGVPAGAAREWVYWQSLNTRDVKAVLDAGLARGDAEMLAALFEPRAFVQNVEITRDGAPISSANARCDEQSVRAALTAISDATVLVRLAQAAAASPDLRVRQTAAAVFASLANDRPMADALQPFVNDPVPTVRRAVARATSRLPIGMQRTLALDASFDVAVDAITQITDPALIEELARTASADRAETVLHVAAPNGVLPALIALMERIDIEDRLAAFAFKLVAARDSSAFVRLARVFARDERAIRDKVVNALRSEFGRSVEIRPDANETLRGAAAKLNKANNAADYASVVAALESSAQAIDEVWRAARREELFEKAKQAAVDAGGKPDSTSWEAVGMQLASVSDRDELVAKLRESPDSRVGLAAAWGLASLGAKAELVALLSNAGASDDLGWLVAPLIAVGAQNEVLAAAFEGRLSATRVWDELLRARAFLAAGRLRYPPSNRHVVMQSMMDETMSAIAGALEEAGDVETLLRAAGLDANPTVVRTLLRMSKHDVLFDALPKFPRNAAANIAVTLEQLTKAARVDRNDAWPALLDQQSQQIASWRAALAKK